MSISDYELGSFFEYINRFASSARCKSLINLIILCNLITVTFYQLNLEWTSYISYCFLICFLLDDLLQFFNLDCSKKLKT